MLGLLLSLFDRLIDLDHALFRRINQDWIHTNLDPLLVWIRHSIHWIPLYVALLIWAVWKFRWTGLYWFGAGGLAVALSDLIGNYGFKHVFERLRPCNDPSMQAGLRLLIDQCGNGFSFVSNHATNHMCLAFFVWVSLRERIGHWGWIGVLWALSIGYAQIYVGLHFPSDIIAGSLLGGSVGTLMGWSFRQHHKNSIFPENQLP
ncbi:MAG: phosphatase PAP2 family protein [Bacteroidetes bacterium]|nr:phosphatase PAP2 family protein [Bacteroidota bacterium]